MLCPPRGESVGSDPCRTPPVLVTRTPPSMARRVEQTVARWPAILARDHTRDVPLAQRRLWCVPAPARSGLRQITLRVGSDRCPPPRHGRSCVRPWSGWRQWAARLASCRVGIRGGRRAAPPDLRDITRTERGVDGPGSPVRSNSLLLTLPRMLHTAALRPQRPSLPLLVSCEPPATPPPTYRCPQPRAPSSKSGEPMFHRWAPTPYSGAG
jgi:hypothetical protein